MYYLILTSLFHIYIRREFKKSGGGRGNWGTVGDTVTEENPSEQAEGEKAATTETQATAEGEKVSTEPQEPPQKSQEQIEDEEDAKVIHCPNL